MLRRQSAYVLVLILALTGIGLVQDSQGDSDGINAVACWQQNLPSDTLARPFLPGKIGTGFDERDMAIAPDMRSFFFSMQAPGNYVILFVECKDGLWSDPQVAPFSGRYFDIEPCFSADGNRLYFVSNRPLTPHGETKDFDIWYVEKMGTAWGDPRNVGAPVNTDKNEFYPSLSHSGSLLFCAGYETGRGGEDLYLSRWQDGQFQTPQLLPDSINTPKAEFNACLAHDESYIIFTSSGWGRGFGGGDLLISYKKDDQTWTQPINMGAGINTPTLDYCPSLSPDGKYLFYTSSKTNHPVDPEKPWSYATLKAALMAYGNGSQDIFWIEAGCISRLKPTHLH